MIGGSWLGLALTTGMTMNRFLLALGIACIIASLLWPWLKRVHLFHLPGDILIDRPGFKFIFPITTMLIVSAVLSLLTWLLRR
jgi:hypothetical protein